MLSKQRQGTLPCTHAHTCRASHTPTCNIAAASMAAAPARVAACTCQTRQQQQCTRGKCDPTAPPAGWSAARPPCASPRRQESRVNTAFRRCVVRTQRSRRLASTAAAFSSGRRDTCSHTTASPERTGCNSTTATSHRNKYPHQQLSSSCYLLTGGTDVHKCTYDSQHAHCECTRNASATRANLSCTQRTLGRVPHSCTAPRH